METTTATLTLQRGRERSLRRRHPWIFSGAVGRTTGTPAPGDLVDVLAADGTWLARGYFNPHSQIRVRVLSWDEATPIDEDFWRRRLAQALAWRAALSLAPQTDAYRLVNAEADGLPGLIVDRYADYLVIQCLTQGIATRRDLLLRLLEELLAPAGIVERSDADVVRKEGLAKTRGLVAGSAPPAQLEIRENGLRAGVSLLDGHKTGYYLDQRDNRLRVCSVPFVGGRTVLNVFSYTGGFALNAAAAGAGAITNIDSSADVLALAEANMARNGWTGRSADHYLQGNAFQMLRDLHADGQQYDVIILDPPKLAHSKGEIDRACRGYKDLNLSAFRLLPPGGLLATFSCSGLVSADLFQKVVFGAALDAGREAQIVAPLHQGPDHPVLLTFPEAAYLKGLLCRVW